MPYQDYRQEFEQILTDTIIPEGTAQDETHKKLSSLAYFIRTHIPTQLFRYRSCTELNIDAFDRDVLYAISPEKFNDPYDALFRYDKDSIMNDVKAALNIKVGKRLLHYIAETDTVPDFFIKLYGSALSEELKKKVRVNKSNLDKLVEELFSNFQPHIDKFLLGIESCLLESAQIMKQSAAVACFSESIDSVLMWSHYADYHKGVALGYDFRLLR